MKGKRLISGAAALVAGGFLAASPALAQTPAPTITADQASAAALAAEPGTVLEIELEREGGRLAYEVEIRRGDGQVVEVMVDPSNGAVLGKELDDADGPGDDEDRPAVSRSARHFAPRLASQHSAPLQAYQHSASITAI